MAAGADDGIQLRRALTQDLDQLAPLFDAYRQFYGKPADLALAREFLRDRFRHEQSVIFVAADVRGVLCGFTQLYPSFSSVSAQRIYILNDLFVTQEARRCRVGQRLLDAAASHARAVGAIRLTLSTAIDNNAAQRLYEGAGWQRDRVFHVYNLQL